MTGQNPSNDEKKIKIKPRPWKTASPDEDSAEVEESKKPASKLTSRVQPMGIPFEARAQSRPLPGSSEPEPSDEPKADVPEDTGKTTEISSSHAAPAGALAPKEVFQIGKWIRKTLQRRVKLKHVLIVFSVLIVLFAWMFFSMGKSSQRAQMLAVVARQGVEISPDFQAQLDSALKNLRDGDAEKALGRLLVLEQKNSSVSSLTYLVALAAMQNGDSGKALEKADESIAKHERVSDSLALKAVVETQQNNRGFGDPRVRAEAFLRQAMVADEANPFPCVELATLLRYSGRNEEATQLLEAARSRLNPVDSHTVVDTTIGLLNLQNLPDPELPNNINPDKDTPSLFAAAYVAMRKGDFGRASALLKSCRERLPSDLYYYLVNDPAMRKFVRQPEVAEFFQ